MKKIFTVIFLLFSFNSFCQLDAIALMKGTNISKKEIAMMINKLKTSGKITDKQAEDALKSLGNLSDSDIDSLKNQAIEKVQSGEIKIPQ